MDSHTIWEMNNETRKKNTKTENDFTTDILIIGGGIAGLSTTYFLINEKKNITLIDKAEIVYDITSKTTAKITYLQEITYQLLEKNFSKIVSKNYYNSQKDAINIIKDIIKKEKIECDLEKCESYIFTQEEKGISKIKKEKELLESFHTQLVELINKHYQLYKI